MTREDQNSSEAHAKIYWVKFALSDNPNVWKRIQVELRSKGIRCIEGEMHLGVMALMIDSKDFEQAKRVAERLIASDSLTVRIAKDNDGRYYDVYESGKRIRGES